MKQAHRKDKEGNKLEPLLDEFQKKANPSKAMLLSGFFKTGKGEYGEGDVFLGLTVPEQRVLAKKYLNLDFHEIQFLINSEIHEHRLTGLIILTYKYELAEKEEKKEKNKEKKKEKAILKKQIFYFYLSNSKKINNWDLVDVTSPRIVGMYLAEKKEKERKILYRLAKSKNLWEKRIAIISTFAFIRKGDFADTLAISEILMQDKHDLIHKAVGWMLREVGKKDKKTEMKFLEKHARHMPRTMLRYAIEKFSEEEKKYYMKKKSSF